MSTASSRESSGGDDSSLGETIRDYRYYALFVGLELFLGVLAIGLDAFASDAEGENTVAETLAGMIGGWMLVVAITAVALFLIVRGLEAMEGSDESYRDYLQS